MRPIALIRASGGLALAELLREIGAPVERLWERNGLPPIALLEPESLVPFHLLGRFAEDAAADQGIDDLGVRLARRSGLRAAGSFGAAIFHAPTLHAALETARDAVHGHNSGAQYWTVLEGDSVRLDIKQEVSSIANAARRFLDQQAQMDQRVHNVFTGHLRAIVGNMTVEEMIRDREKLTALTRSSSGSEMEKLGLIVDSLQIQEIDDTSGYITNIGRPHAAAVERDARIAQAQADQAATEAEQAADAKKSEALIKSNFDDGSALGVTGTPAFFINGRMLVGAQPIEQFREVINDEEVEEVFAVLRQAQAYHLIELAMGIH
jgi:nitroreductase